MKTSLLPFVLLLGCVVSDRSIGEEIEEVDPSGAPTDDGATGNLDGDATAGDSGESPAGMHVGAVLGSEGLCPFQFGEAYALTLQFTPATHVCSAYLWDVLENAGETPNWYVWVGLPVAEPGVYDLAEIAVDDLVATIGPDGGDGGSMGDISFGTLEIITIDENGVTGSLSGVTKFNLGKGDMDINGRFTASWCSEAEWLDMEFDQEDAPVEGFDPACKLPGG